MEQLLRNMHEETAGRVAVMPYTCMHFMITQRRLDGKNDIHILHEGTYVVHCVESDDPFEGHPFCLSCQGGRQTIQCQPLTKRRLSPEPLWGFQEKRVSKES